ncbi:MAG: polymer-forming cytoskeletal protein [Clostridium sp.]|nr:polymer-forming cytoskeletal protein [Clostridium sp.]MCM1208570.1 polymer-forming cytoskeletal protein [Ruminococcus sp.]
MGFFKDFKRDFAQAVNELMPDQDELANEYDDEDMVNTFDENDNMDIAPEDMLEDLDDLSLDIEKGEYDDDEDYENEDASYDDDLDVDEDYDDDDDDLEDIPQAEMIEDKHDISIDNLDKSAKNHDDDEEYVDVEALLFKEFLADEEPEEKEEEKPKTTKPKAAKKPAPSKSKKPEAEDIPSEVEEGKAATPVDDTEDADTASAEDAVSEKEEPSENAEADVADAASEKVEDEDKAGETDKTDSLFDVDLEKAALEAVLKQEEKKENNKKGKEKDMEEKQTDDNLNEADIIAELMEADTDISISQKEENVESILSEDTTYVTKGTTIKGSISTEGGIDLIGTVEGDVECKGKLIVGGCVKGNIAAGEVYANAARIEGETKSEGSVKIGVGTVVVGNIIASSAVIAGAVNGDIDIKGPVIVDSTAVIMGNIKSRSVQINNGAVIEGFCSQCYSEIDVKSFFE